MKKIPFDMILLRRTVKKNIDGYEFNLTELSAFDSLKMQRTLERIKAGEYVHDDRSWLVSIISPMTLERIEDISTLIKAASFAVELGCSDVILQDNNSNKNKHINSIDLPDSYLLRVLDIVSARYGRDPLELSKIYTIRQIMYLFVCSFNALLDERRALGMDIKDNVYLNAYGMTMSLKSMSKTQKLQYYAELSRRSKNGK